MTRLTIVQHNVRHWQNNKNALTNTYNHLDPDIILLNEHSNTDRQTLKIFNYLTFQTNKDNRLNAGAAIAIKKNLPFRLHDDFNSDMLAVTIETRQGPITIATTYIPPRDDYINFIDFNDLLSRPHPVYLIGDLNARHRILGSSNNNRTGRHLLTLIEQDKCQVLGPNFPTFHTHRSATSPDIAISNLKTFHNIHFKPGPLTPSDHIPIIATISANPIQIPIRPRRSFYNADWTGYRTTLSETNFPRLDSPTMDEIDDRLENWTKTVKDATDKHIPTIRHRTIPGIRKNRTIDLLEIQYQATLDYVATNGPSPDLYRHINELRSDISNEYRQLNNEKWTGLINNLNDEDDATTFWKTIKRMQGNNKQTLPYLRDHHNNKVHTPEDKERLFTDHWKTIFTTDEDEEADEDAPIDFIDTIKQELLDRLELISPLDQADMTLLNDDFPPITMTEFNDALKTMKQKAPGPSEITALQLKNLPLNMKQTLLDIFNNSIATGYFPDKLKYATMIFIPKTQTSQLHVQNFRPISLLDVEGKLLDKILNRRLTKYLDSNDMHNPRQHGFRRKRGTHTALATFHETVTKLLAQKMKVDVTLRDVTKAFDKVWHTGLKYKISRLPLHPNFTKILCDFLTDRTASVRVGGHVGPAFELESGVPQGACLSPTLYNLYTADLPPPIDDSDYICFADDISQLTYSPYTYETVAHTTKHAIQQINDFEDRWKIKTNATKFTIVPISRRRTDEITLDNDKTLPYSTKGKLLGLNFNTYGITPQTKIRTEIGRSNLDKLIRFRHLSTTLKRRLYITTVRSALIYPTIPLHTCSNSATLRLQRIQNRALRFITNTHWTDFKTSRQLHDETNLPPLNVLLHDHARRIWEDLEDSDPVLYDKLTFSQELNDRQHRLFKSSRLLALSPPPPPLYV